MKLWLLRPHPKSKLWDPWYDKAFGFVVRAPDERTARKLAQKDGGDEVRDGDPAWTAPRHSTCVELIADEGEPGVVIRDFASA